MFFSGLPENGLSRSGESSGSASPSRFQHSVGILLAEPVDEIDRKIEDILMASELNLDGIETLINEESDEPMPKPEAISILVAYAAQWAVFNKERIA